MFDELKEVVNLFKASIISIDKQRSLDSAIIIAMYRAGVFCWRAKHKISYADGVLNKTVQMWLSYFGAASAAKRFASGHSCPII